jgi:predicted AlkP superfamily phosphohydrolase/phosphomutase
MSGSSGPRLLAIGIDAAEGTLVRALIERGEMPALESLLAQGQWLRVRSTAHIGSATVWPTFVTGQDPAVHGVYSEWGWRPDTMSLERYHGRHLTPFWKGLIEREIPVGVFDVPFTLPVGMSNGFEVCEWWTHDTTEAGLQVRPDRMLSLVNQSPPHPLSANRFVHTTPDRVGDLKELAAASIAGVRLRGLLAQRLIRETAPRLALMVFPEIHHAGHQLWHTIDPDNPLYVERGLTHGDHVEPLMGDVYRAVDEEIGALIKSAGSDASVMVFALHGFRPALGFPAFLGPLLCERGISRLASWGSQSWTGRVLSLFGAAKRHAPASLKQLYYKVTPTSTTRKLARPTMVPVYDWAHTRAFSLPTDQYGWIRVNLAGREAQGIVPLDRYEETCSELERMLMALTTEGGRPLVRDVTRTAPGDAPPLHHPLPDLVVHWADGAFEYPLRIRGSAVQVAPVGRKSTGQHASEGFCLYRGPREWGPDAEVTSRDLGRAMADIVS